jgi:hypothetical protein
MTGQLTPDGFAISINDAATRKNQPPAALLSVGAPLMGGLVWANVLTQTQRQEFDQITGVTPPATGQLSFFTTYMNWLSGSYKALDTALNSTAPGAIQTALFMASLFTDLATPQLYTYTSLASLATKVAVSLTPTLWQFGPYKFTLGTDPSTGNPLVTSYQVGTDVPHPISSAFALSSLISPYTSEKFSRAGSNLQLTIRQSTDPNGSLTSVEKDGLVSALNLLPLESLQGLQMVQVLPVSARPTTSVSLDYDVQGDVITLYLPSAAARAASSIPVRDAFAAAVGWRLYNTLSAPAVSQKDFAQMYADWVDNSSFDDAFNQAADGGTSSSLQSALSMAAFFTDKAAQTIRFYAPGPGETLMLRQVPITRTATLLDLGSYEFQLQGNQVIAIRWKNKTLPKKAFIAGRRASSNAWIPLSTPLALPQALLDRLAPAAAAPVSSRSEPIAIVESAGTIVAPTAGQPAVMLQSLGAPTRYVPVLSNDGQKRAQRMLELKSLAPGGLVSPSQLSSPDLSSHPVLQAQP